MLASLPLKLGKIVDVTAPHVSPGPAIAMPVGSGSWGVSSATLVCVTTLDVKGGCVVVAVGDAVVVVSSVLLPLSPPPQPASIVLKVTNTMIFILMP